jgi:general secretion pathway protein K
LLLTTLAITLVASLFWQQQVQVRAIENQRLQLQKKWILRGALDWARLILRESGRAAYDSLNDPWAVPLAETRLDQYVENGQADTDASDAVLSGSIIDAQSRYNLANLCSKGTPNPKEIAVFARLLLNLRLNPALAQATADMMAAAQKKPETAQSSAPLPMDIVQIEDLLAVPGFSPDMLLTLKDFVIVLPSAGAAAATAAVTPVNLNTASAEVLAARLDTLSLADAAVIVARRAQAPFRSVSDVIPLFPGRQLTLPPDQVSAKTDYFIVNGKVRLNRATLEVQSLIHRPPGLYPEIVWIREN